MTSSRRTLWLVLLVLALTLIPRLEPALRGFNFSRDAAEYLLLARSLRAGQGFRLPVRVRFPAEGPADHEAFGERAPLYPLLLAIVTPAEPGWPPAGLQLLGVALAALAALLACSLSAELARRRGLRGAAWSLAVLLGGLTVGWLPYLVRASVHLWAEPLGLVLALGALRAAWAAEDSRAWLVVEILCVGAARFARPEAWVLVPVLLLWHWSEDRRRHALWLAVGVGLLNVAGVALTGVLAPQLDLLRTGHFGALMSPETALARPSAREALAGIARNFAHQASAALQPRNAALIVPFALLSLARREGRLLLVAAGALMAATVVVWSTDDPTRFLIAPLALSAPVAAVELLARWRAHAGGRRWVLAAVLGVWVGVIGHAAGRSWRGRSAEAPLIVVFYPGEPRLADPWRYALLTGRPAVLDHSGAK